MIIWRPIIYARYFLVVTGLLIFAIAYVMGKIGNKKGNIAMIILTVLVSLAVNINLMETNYDKSNQEPFEYIKENVQEGDIFIYGNEGSGFVVSTIFPEYMDYFYDGAHWGVEEAYKAYGPKMETVYDLDFLENYTGRIWFVNSSDHTLYEETKQNYDGLELIKQAKFNVKYQKYQYAFSLVEKVR